MKQLFILILLLGSSCLKAQTGDYPKYMTDGGKTYVVMTVPQAQKLDNDAELLQMYKQLQPGADSLKQAYVSVINSYGSQVALLNLKISELDGMDASQKSLIDNLNSQINNYKQDLADADKQSKDKDGIIRNQAKEIRRQKIKKVVGYGIGAVVVVGILLITHL